MARGVELLDADELSRQGCLEGNGMRLITCHFPRSDLQAMKDLIQRKRFANRSELVRYAVKSLLLEYGYR